MKFYSIQVGYILNECAELNLLIYSKKTVG